MAYKIGSNQTLNNKVFVLQDHFAGDRAAFWTFSSGGGAGESNNASPDSTHPGTFDMLLGTGSFANCYLGLRTDGNNAMILGGGPVSMKWIVLLDPLSTGGGNDYNFYVGYGDLDYAEADNGCYFKYNHAVNSGRYQCITAAGGSRTTVDSGVTVNTSYRTFEININPAATSVQFLIDGTVVATNTTNIPSVAISANCYIVNNGTASIGALARVDFFGLWQNIN